MYFYYKLQLVGLILDGAEKKKNRNRKRIRSNLEKCTQIVDLVPAKPRRPFCMTLTRRMSLLARIALPGENNRKNVALILTNA